MIGKHNSSLEMLRNTCYFTHSQAACVFMLATAEERLGFLHLKVLPPFLGGLEYPPSFEYYHLKVVNIDVSIFITFLD